MKPDIQQIKIDFENLQKWAQSRIQFYTNTYSPVYSQAALAKKIGVSSKTVLFGLELSSNMSHKKWLELADGLNKLDTEKRLYG